MTTRFTEDDLRAALDEHSTGGTPPPDLCRNAERAGRRLVHRRASTAGGVLAVGALAAGATVAALPSAGANGTTHGTHGTHVADGISPADGGDPVTLLPADGRIAAAQYTYGEAMHMRLTFTPRGVHATIITRCTGDGRPPSVRVDNAPRASWGTCARYADGRDAPMLAMSGLTPGKPRTVDVTIVPAGGTTGMKGSWAVGVYER
jgi:hypothetical protein